jgi:phosphoglycerol transferase
MGLRHYSPVLVDGPELRGFTVNATGFFVFWLLGVISLIIWAINRKWGASIYVFLFVPLAMATSLYFVNMELRQRLVTDAYDEAGQFAHSYLGGEASKLVIAGTDLASLYRTLFYVDNSKATFIQVPNGAPLESSKIPTGKTWLLLIGDHQPPSTDSYQISTGHYSLIRVSADELVDFRNKQWPRVLTEITGASDPEGFGRWSNAEEVVMKFTYPLPKRFQVALTAYAFGPNVDQPFKIRIGQHEQMFRLAASPQEVTLSFDSTGSERILRITIPKPISPKELGMSVDDRRLGIALQLLRIDDLSDKR